MNSDVQYRLLHPDEVVYVRSGRGGLRPLRTLRERLFSRVCQGGLDECWPWQGSTMWKGYGEIGIGARHVARTHVVAWVIHHGRLVTPGKVIRHSCDNRVCCNPAHLIEGTARENTEDMYARGRARPGGVLQPAREV